MSELVQLWLCRANCSDLHMHHRNSSLMPQAFHYASLFFCYMAERSKNGLILFQILTMGRNRKQQQAPQPKAWTGTNPITQRASTNNTNGTEKPLPKVPSQSQTKSSTESHSDKHAHDRALFVIANFTVCTLCFGKILRSLTHSTGGPIILQSMGPTWLHMYTRKTSMV